MDIHAANVVLGSQAELWQIPMDVYKQFGVSLAELQLKVKPHGKIGKKLKDGIWPHGELWGLRNQAAIAVLMEELEKVSYEMIQAPKDFFAKLALNFPIV